MATAKVEGQTVKVGDVVWFKSDYEQAGRIVKIEGDRLTLHNPHGFGGEYLRYATETVERAQDCWLG
jgi:FKBP-type peptidyl-prolyl cis-trans isomerase 2